MAIVNFQFTGVEAKRAPSVKGPISIQPNITLKDVSEQKLEVSTASGKAIKVSFAFIVKYKPQVAELAMEGSLVTLLSADVAEAALAEWKAKKTLPKTILPKIMNTIFAKAQTQAIVVAKDFGLPSPVRLPKLRVEESAQKK